MVTDLNQTFDCFTYLASNASAHSEIQPSSHHFCPLLPGIVSRIRTLDATDPEFKAEHVTTSVPNGPLLPGFANVYRGIVRGVFRQQAGGAWFPCKIFFFARSCLGKVPGRAPFSQLSKRATACTIRMQIVKQINENELDIRKTN